MRYRILITGLAIILFSSVLNAQVKLPALLSDNMVMQRNSEVKIWGWASPGEVVKVSGDWFDSLFKTTTGDDGRWELRLKTGDAGGPHFLVLEGANKVKLENILFGEVWVCSGQSNMVFSIKMMGGWDTDNFAKDKQDLMESDYSQVRLFDLKRNTSAVPLDDCEGSWQIPDVDLVENFSAVAWFFGTNLLKSLEVPVGLISTNWGGTPAEAWTSSSTLSGDPDLRYYHTENLGKRSDQRTPSMLYNAMINPVLNYSIKGTTWYQGEANRNDAYHYRKLFPAMINDWRKAFGQGDFPFYFVQIAPFNYREKMAGALAQEAQLMTLGVANTGMVVTSDIGNIDNIHPTNKQEVGRRLALNALALTYGQDYLDFSGPLYKSMDTRNSENGKEIVLSFDYVESGLEIRGEELTHIIIAGTDRQFVKARAKIENETLVVSSPEVPEPVAVRFGFSNTAEPNLFNGAGLPASPFRTDDWFINTLIPGIRAEATKRAGRYEITISSIDPSAVIRYTIDGTDPVYNSKRFTKPFKQAGVNIIKARIFIDGTGSVNIAEFKIPIKE